MVDRLVTSEANSSRIAAIDNCFGIFGVPLALPGRVLVGEGVLTKMCRKRPKSRQFFLFNDILVYGNIVIGKRKYNKQHIMPLEEVSLENIDDCQQYRNGWLIRTMTKSFVVCAATATEKQDWMGHIHKCVEDLLRKSGKKPVENHAAVWVPDAEANICMHCKNTQFTMIVRRHHCRNCGAVVCGPCSSKKFMFPQLSPKPQRVCTSCYDRLSKVVKPESAKISLSNPTRNDSQNNAANETSGYDDSEYEANGGHEQQQHDEAKFYEDTSITASKSNNTHVNSSHTPIN